MVMPHSLFMLHAKTTNKTEKCNSDLKLDKPSLDLRNACNSVCGLMLNNQVILTSSEHDERY